MPNNLTPTILHHFQLNGYFKAIKDNKIKACSVNITTKLSNPFESKALIRYLTKNKVTIDEVVTL